MSAEEVWSCSVCGVELREWSERVWPVGQHPRLTAEGVLVVPADAGSELSVTCRKCAGKTPIGERENVDEQDIPEAPEKLAADAPPGETYGTQQAAQVLGVSPRRVTQLAQEGRLEIAQEKPLRVSAQSVHELRAERAGKGKHPLAAPPPESVADQVERLVALVTAEQRRAIEAGETLLSEVSRQRDEMRSEVERLRAENERLREESQKPRKWWGRS